MAAPMAPRRGQHVIKAETAQKLMKMLAGSNYTLIPVPDQPNPEQDNYPFPIKYVERPPGVPGKGPPCGFHPGDIIGLTRKQHELLMGIVDLTLRQTPGVDMQCSKTKQKTQHGINTAKLKIVARVPTLCVYEDDGYWPVDCLIYCALKSTKEKYNQLDKQAKLELEKVEQTDQDAQEQDLVKAAVPVQEDAGAPVQVDTGSGAEARTEDDEDVSKLQVSHGSNDPDDPDDLVEAIAHEISSMSLFISADADTSMAEDTIEDTVLPADLVGPPLSTQVLVPTHSAVPEVPSSTSGTLLMPTSSGSSSDVIQDKLTCLKALSPADHTQLPLGIQMLLDLLDMNSQLPALHLVVGLLDGIPDTAYTTPTPISTRSAPIATPASAPKCSLLSTAPMHHPIAAPALTSAPVSQPKGQARLKMQTLSPSQPPPEPEATSTSGPATSNPLMPTDSAPAPSFASGTAAGSTTRLGSRLGSRPLTINELEPGPTTLQVDDDDDDNNSLSDLSSIANPNEAQKSHKLQDKNARGSSSGGGRGRGRGRGGTG
ncbi:hypothetical protein FRC11_009450 [Ceratobasidium sp. 423]|nr:hypothetical protein FRC11_009450 [Ceratobasidium sp. 423]